MKEQKCKYGTNSKGGSYVQKLLTDEFINSYSDEPEHMNNLGKFVFYRTYSRWLEEKGRRETFKEAIRRAVEYNVGLSVKQTKDNGFDIPIEDIKAEAELLFDNVFNLRQFLSGRTHWVGGADTDVATKYPLANFNCSFLEIKEWKDLADLFYLLLIGTGVGLSCSKKDALNLPPIRRNYKLMHSEYEPVSPDERLERTKVVLIGNGYVKMYVGDSKEGWVSALRIFLQLITEERFEDMHHIKISYNSIRPRGERLKTFGGTASGYEPLRDMFDGIDKVFKDKLDTCIEPMEGEVIWDENNVEYYTGKYYVRPIHILDIANLIGNNVVAGGVRRTAEIFLCDEDDYEVILAKYGVSGIYDEKAHEEIGKRLYAMNILPEWWDDEAMLEERKSLTHRYMSNNSIKFENKPSNEFIELVFLLIKTNGEPGFINQEEMLRRRPNGIGVNPCAEIILDSQQVCNLTTINIMAFVKEKEDGTHSLDMTGLLTAQALSVRAGMRMTLVDLELEGWNKKHKRDRLIGTSMTGWKDATEKLEMNEAMENNVLQTLKEVAFDESLKYANALRIANPLLITTVKPEGTLSQVAGGVSSGLHQSHSPYYIRRVRVNSADPIAEVVKELNWTVHAEVGTKVKGYSLYEEEELATQTAIDNASTIVVDFPIKSPSKITKGSLTAKEQLETYFQFQKYYTQHNSSNTVTVKENEWEEVKEIVLDNWDDFVGVSFIPHGDNSYTLMPYEEITKEEYEEAIGNFDKFNIQDLYNIEQTENTLGIESDCEDG